MEYSALLELADKLRSLNEEEREALLNTVSGMIDGVLLSRSIRAAAATQTPAAQPAT